MTTMRMNKELKICCNSQVSVYRPMVLDMKYSRVSSPRPVSTARAREPRSNWMTW